MTLRLTAEQRSYLESLSPRVAACKGNRRHPFPVLVPGEPIPPGVFVRRITGGFEITYHCPVCTRWRREETGASALLGSGEVVVYGGGGENFIAKGLDLTASDHRQFYAERLAKTIKNAAKGRTRPS